MLVFLLIAKWNRKNNGPAIKSKIMSGINAGLAHE
jgi:hypothetical protein